MTNYLVLRRAGLGVLQLAPLLEAAGRLAGGLVAGRHVLRQVEGLPQHAVN